MTHKLLIVVVVLTFVLGCESKKPSADAPAPDAAAGSKTNPGSQQPSKPSKPEPLWPEYVSDGGNYKVRMPAEPAVDRTEDVGKDGQIVLQEMAVVEVGLNEAFLSSHTIESKTDMTNPQTVLGDVRDAQLSYLSATLDKEERIELGGHPGIALVGTMPDRNIVRIRAYLVDGELYQLLAAGPPGEPHASRAQRFFESFQLLP